MKKRTKRFLGTLAIIGVFTIGTVFGSETILKFEGTNTIEEAKTLIQELTKERNTIVDEYNKLDTTATDKITKLDAQITELTTQKEELEKQINDYKNGETYLELNKQIEKLKEEIDSLKSKITSLEAEIARKDAELKGKDRLLEEKDEKIKYYENIEPTKEIARLRTELETANSKCNELQETMNNIELKNFEESELTKKGN